MGVGGIHHAQRVNYHRCSQPNLRDFRRRRWRLDGKRDETKGTEKPEEERGCPNSTPQVVVLQTTTSSPLFVPLPLLTSSLSSRFRFSASCSSYVCVCMCVYAYMYIELNRKLKSNRWFLIWEEEVGAEVGARIIRIIKRGANHREPPNSVPLATV